MSKLPKRSVALRVGLALMIVAFVSLMVWGKVLIFLSFDQDKVGVGELGVTLLVVSCIFLGGVATLGIGLFLARLGRQNPVMVQEVDVLFERVLADYDGKPMALHDIQEAVRRAAETPPRRHRASGSDVSDV